MQSANKVALNTGILYVRLILTVGITLYATRLVLNALGAADFGVFNLVAGVIAMLSFLSNAMATSTQRYLSFHQGKNDMVMQKKVFTNSIVLHIAIGLLMVMALQVAGLFLFDGFLNIPANRLDAAKVIYHFMSVTVLFTVLAVPFTGSLTAHENMLWVAIVNSVEAFSKLAIALVLLAVSSDKLVVFGLLTAGTSILSFAMYAIYCFNKYEDCTLEGIGNIDKPLIKELTSFAGWNLVGSLCTLARLQGIAIILNLFHGARINASYGIANQVSAQLNFFSATMLRALNPQIMKSEGSNDRPRMLRLSMMASKFGFFLLAFIAIPCIFEMPVILKLWLKNVPEYTVIFCNLALVAAMVNQLTIGLVSALQAVGNIKVYQIVVGSFLLLSLPMSYLLLHLGYPPYSVLVGYVVIEVIACVLRFITIKRVSGLSFKDYAKRVLAKVLLPILVNIGFCLIIVCFIDHELRFLLTFSGSILLFFVSIYFTGLCIDEKELVHKMVGKLTDTIKKKFSNHPVA